MIREYALGENSAVAPKRCPLSILTQFLCLGSGIYPPHYYRNKPHE